MQHICLTHVISGIDEDGAPDAPDGAVGTSITGYTEWANHDSPAITIGWDWQMLAAHGDVVLQRVSPPRSNLMLQNPSRADVGPAKTEVLLEAIIDQLDWQPATLHDIYRRYSA